ncbi:hypothetical protein SDC9_129977 [bioreactor metagenome]|uniref:EpsG family protein n=1 Tax=bioreactor metagenome TaxID=1076179 RepID=A0A645D1B3_9ZZZZ
MMIAISIHFSAIIFTPVIFLQKIKLSWNKIFIASIIMLVCVILNVSGVSEILTIFGKNTDYRYSTESIYQLGGALVLIILIAITSIYTYFTTNNGTEEHRLANIFSVMLLTAICTLLLFNGSILLRSSMYYYYVIIVAFPLFLSKLNNIISTIISIIFIGIMLWHFFPGELLPFDLLPYKVASDLSIFR